MIPTIRAECGCGCGLIGSPRRRPWRNGQTCIKRCLCKRCEASRHGKRASARERAIARAVGGVRVPLSGQGGGPDVSGRWDIEETSNEAVVRGIRRWWESKTVRTKTAAIYSRALVPRALVLSWPDTLGGPRKRRLVVMTWDDFEWNEQRGRGA